MQYDPGVQEQDRRYAQTNQNREEFVLQLFRLFKLVTMHQLHNQAVQRSIEAASDSFQKMLLEEQTKLTVLFGGSDIFVNGQPLKASRGTYESATELGNILETLGANEVSISQDFAKSDLESVLGAFVQTREQRGNQTPVFKIHGRVSVTYVDPSYLMGMDEEEMALDDQLIRTYTSALVMLQRAYEAWQEENYVYMRIIKRIAQRLVMFSEEHDSALVQATALRTSGQDMAEQALVTAMTAVVTARLLTRDLKTLTAIATSALCLDIGKARLMALTKHEDDPFRLEGAPIELREDALANNTASTAMGMIDLAGLFDTALQRLTITYEAAHFDRTNSDKTNTTAPYQNRIPPTIDALIVSMSYKFHLLMADNEPVSGESLDMDALIESWLMNTNNRAEHLVGKLICTAMGIYPRGTAIKLSSGWQGVVLGTPKQPTCYSRPMVRLLLDSEGEPCSRDVHLSFLSAEVLQLGHIEEVLHSPTDAMIQLRRDLKHGKLVIPQQAIDAPLLALKRKKAQELQGNAGSSSAAFGMIKPRRGVPKQLEEPDPDTDMLSLTDVHARKVRLDKLRFLASLDDPTTEDDDSLFD